MDDEDINDLEDLSGAHVELGVFEHLPFQETAPLLDALNERHQFVSARRYNGLPPMAGDVDLFITLSFELQEVVGGALGAAGVLFAKAFLEEFAKDTYAAVREPLLALLHKRPAGPGERRWTALELGVGPLSLLFEDPLDDDTFLHRVRRAQELAETLPDLTIIRPEGPEPDWLHWDEASDSWLGKLTIRIGDQSAWEERRRRAGYSPYGKEL
jgi:hypothetical protein